MQCVDDINPLSNAGEKSDSINLQVEDVLSRHIGFKRYYILKEIFRLSNKWTNQKWAFGNKQNTLMKCYILCNLGLFSHSHTRRWKTYLQWGYEIHIASETSCFCPFHSCILQNGRPYTYRCYYHSKMYFMNIYFSPFRSYPDFNLEP